MSNLNDKPYEYTVTEVEGETPAVEIYSRFGTSRYVSAGFFARILFSAAFTGTIEVHLGPTKELLDHIPQLDMVISNDAGAHTFDIVTRGRYLKFVFTAGGSYSANVYIAR